MAVAFNNATSVAEATAVNATYTAPTGIANGDLLLLWHYEYAVGGTPPAATPPTGFSAWPGITQPKTQNVGATAPTDVATQYCWYKIAASESGNYVVTHTSTIRRGIIARVTGNDTVAPFSPNPSINSLGTFSIGGPYTWTGLTTTVDACLILAFGSDNNDTANTLTQPSGTTPTFTKQLQIAGEYLATGIRSPAGATGSPTMTNNSNANTEWFAGFAAIQPPTGVVTAPRRMPLSM